MVKKNVKAVVPEGFKTKNADISIRQGNGHWFQVIINGRKFVMKEVETFTDVRKVKEPV